MMLRKDEDVQNVPECTFNNFEQKSVAQRALSWRSVHTFNHFLEIVALSVTFWVINFNHF